ncbi:Acidic leucine-rich nuclear phosphoprotein 32-related protein 2 [Quillaja saponaria]|uniref:Acidic leucine-rich nuclear phosphoprotein 32-related protein 2 n=1 Tax=Quillaja saponaria TaxID=32244 RepID=A0AAD7LAP1_QUISA|nr:Acidic leucine-rich nuclear phosphoprotein 32-related protein 2 [Quillaja saponaria]
MDTDVKDARSCINEPLNSLGAQKIDLVNGEEDSDSNSLLPPRRGGISRKSNKTRQKVQWNDRNGDKLAEVLVFDPSDISDSDDDDKDTCICTIM